MGVAPLQEVFLRLLSSPAYFASTYVIDGSTYYTAFTSTIVDYTVGSHLIVYVEEGATAQPRIFISQ